MRQKAALVVSIALAVAMLVSTIAAFAYGMHLRAVGSPYPDPATQRTVSAIEWQSRRATTDLYVTAEQRRTAWLLMSPMLAVSGLCGLLLTYEVGRIVIGKLKTKFL